MDDNITPMYKENLKAFVDILFPKTCHICSKNIKDKKTAFDGYICHSCASAMRHTPVVSCLFCGNELTQEKELKDKTCPDCRTNTPAYESLIVCFMYDSTTKALIHKFKYENRPYLAKTISKLIQTRLTEDNLALEHKIDAIVPIPLHPARQREREFNQSEQIAKELATNLRKPILKVLKKTLNTHPQASLKSQNRLNNLKGAFKITDDTLIHDKRLLLVDDVITSATTARESSSVLKQSGAKNITVLAFAKG